MYWTGLVGNQSGTPGSSLTGSRFRWLSPTAVLLSLQGSYQQWGT